MQPYLFPHIGYFQLIQAVDKFVFYDDVNYIKQGWINRNRILGNDEDLVFTVPLKKASSFTFIKDTYINQELYKAWRLKFMSTIFFQYKKAPFFNQVMPLVENVFNSNCVTISELAKLSCMDVYNYLGMTTSIQISSTIYENSDLKRADRVIDICKREDATQYVNVSGGVELYSKVEFNDCKLNLFFIKTSPITYQQFKSPFLAGLSIIDVLMFNDIDTINQMLSQYELV